MVAQVPLFTVNNQHVVGCGQPPRFPDGNFHRSYFEGPFGDQWVFLFNRDTREAQVRCGDIGWGQDLRVIPFEEVYSQVPADSKTRLQEVMGSWLVVGVEGPFTVGKAEQLWLAGCMMAVDSLKPSPPSSPE